MYRYKAAYLFLTVCVAVLTLLSCSAADSPPGGNGLVPGMDLEPKEITFSVDNIADGGSLTITLPIENKAADTVTTDFDVHFYLSTDATFDAAAPDSDLGTANVTTDIAGGTTISINPPLFIPEDAVNECVYIYAVVDSTGVVAETDETNNQSTTITAAVILVYDNETVPPRSYNLFFETYPPTGTIIGTDPDTQMTLYNNAGGVEFTQDSQNGAGNYEQKTYACNSGTYWVLIYGFVGDGPYAFSVRTANIDRKTFSADLGSNAEDQEEASNYPGPPPVATWVDIKVGAESNRYSGINDADWFKIVLP